MTSPEPFDPTRRFVRIVELRADGLVEFEFAVGEPTLFVEMLLPRAAFDDFCAAQRVTPTTTVLAEAPLGSAEHEWDWSLHSARAQHFRHDPTD
jgi:phenol hydroxylase P0 protein